MRRWRIPSVLLLLVALAIVVSTSSAAPDPGLPAANTPPVAPDESLSVKKNTPGTVSPAIFDPDGDEVSITSSAPIAAHGTVTCDLFSCTYTPDTDYLGPDSFQYTVSDGIDTSTGTVSVTVHLNQAPVAPDTSLTTKMNTPNTVFPPFFDYSVAPGSWSRMPLPGLYDVPGWTRGP